ncbi:MAG: NAD(P)H-hydrate epimerase [Planctomycetaceae bacterium]
MPTPDRRPLSRAEVRSLDSIAIGDYGLPGIVLMENAGRGAAELLLQLGVSNRVVICAGKGNNGGDGFVIARHLDCRGCDVEVLLLCELQELAGDAAVNFRVIQAAGLPVAVLGSHPAAAQLSERLSGVEWIVDALLGTGTQGAIREPYLSAIAAINQAQKKVLAVDLPSGMDCDTGRSLGACVVAGHTATFVARKIGFDALGARELTGEVHVIDIGVPRKLLDDVFARDTKVDDRR